MDWLQTNKYKQFYFYGLFVLCLVVYFKAFYFKTISWDDPEMVFNNPDVFIFNLKNFFTNYYVGNYIPITMIVHSINFMLFKDWAGGHHLINIFFHLINAWLLYKLLLSLKLNQTLVFFTVGVFLLHPLQVETVIWISELKTILMFFFFLLACTNYLKFIQTSKTVFYITCILFSTLAGLSKSYAVILPFFFIAIAYYNYKKISLKQITFIIPIFLVSLILGIVNLKSQSSDQFINYSHNYSIYQKICNAGYAIYNYLILFLKPSPLYPLYSFPKFTPTVIGIGLFVVLFIILLFIYFTVKKKYYELILTFLSVISLVLVLQFIPFGEVLYADRYMYVTIIFFSIVFFSVFKFINLFQKPIIILVLLILAFITYTQLNYWTNSKTLYTKVIKHEPNSFVALNSLGVELMLTNNDFEAEQYLQKAILANTKNYKGYYNLGLLYLKINNIKKAISQFNTVLSIKDYNKAIVARASAYYMLQDYSKAMADAERVIEKDPLNSKAYFVLGNCYNDINNLDKAFFYFDKAISINAYNSEFYLKKGIVLGKKQNFQLCLENLNKAIELNSNYGEAYYWRGVALINLKQNPCEDFKQAVKQNYPQAVNALNQYCK
ncbi:MAG: tetratricopeptide repeat protein [Bacteroidetes bacterium]|nr:tetratricopeptide repeat protein [Bacteroidota bacterium]